MFKKAFFVLLFLLASLSNVYAAQTNSQIIIQSGEDQTLIANSVVQQVLLKVVDEHGNAQPGQKIDFVLVGRPSKAKEFKLATSTIVTDAIGLARFHAGKVEVPGDYAVMAQLPDQSSVYTFIKFQVNHESWITYLVFGVMGGLGLFLYGMKLGAGGLQKMAGKRMKAILGAFTNNRYLGVITGIVITAITQSSSATTVMLVGFVNASLMNITQALSVILGANLGTTITVQLIAFDISNYALLMIGLGFIFRSSKNKTTSYSGDILMGFGMIFYGMAIMSVSMSPLRSYPAFKEMLLSFSDYPISAIVGSMLFTALVQSSGAAIGLVVVFAGQGLITLESAIPLILGAGTGTCITGWLAAMGGSSEAKKTAMLNILFNILGTFVFIPFLYGSFHIADLIRWYTNYWEGSDARAVANAHMFCAGIKLVVMWPFYYKIIELADYLIADEENEETRSTKAKYLSESLLEAPELALGNVAREIVRMAGHVEYMIEKVPALVSYGDEELIKEVSFREEKVDASQYQITHYLSALSQNFLTDEQTKTMVRYMHIINNLESQADLIDKVIVPFARNKAKYDIRFSEEGFRELMQMFNHVHENFMLAINAFATFNVDQAKKIIDNEDNFDILVNEYRNSHMSRVFQQKVQSIETSTRHMDLLGCFKRINTNSIDLAKAMTGDWHGIDDLVSTDLKGKTEVNAAGPKEKLFGQSPAEDIPDPTKLADAPMKPPVNTGKDEPEKGGKH